MCIYAGLRQTGYVVMNETAAVIAAGMHKIVRMTDAEAVAVHFAMIDNNLVQEAHGAQKKVFGWTANTQKMMLNMLNSAVDAIITTYPSVLKVRKTMF